MDVTVVGAGVAGLSTAVRLLEAGHRVRVLAEGAPGTTTSAVAAAVWYPYRAEPRDRVLRWGARTAEVLRALAGRGVGGVRLSPVVEVVPAGTPDPWFAGAVTGFRRAGAGDLPPGAPDGWCFVAPVAPMPAYLPWLAGEARRLGARFEDRRLAGLDEAAGGAEAVVCCPGLGARELVGDTGVEPVRGQVVVVENPGLERVVIDEAAGADPTYVIPRGHDCVLGGTAQAGAWSVEPDPVTAASILERCTALEPRVARARVLAHKVGLRPVRRSVRLEVVEVGGTPVVHNYGHGGAGVTLSWGCAEEAAGLLATA